MSVIVFWISVVLVVYIHEKISSRCNQQVKIISPESVKFI